MNILVTGASGMVGSRFVELYSNKDELLTPNEKQLDLTSEESIKKYFNNNKVDTVVNFAAYTDVRAAENQKGDEKSISYKLNFEAVKNLTDICRRKNIYLIQISTDMVFPGSKNFPGPYEEKDQPKLEQEILTWYGYTKALGEDYVKKNLINGAVLRIVYPVTAKFDTKLDFLRKSMKLYDEGKLYPMFADQQVSISFVDNISQIINALLKSKKGGVFHATCSDVTSPYKLVSYLLWKTRGVKNSVKKTSIMEFLQDQKSNVRYPLYGGLEGKITSKKLGTDIYDSKKIIDMLITQNISY